MKGLRMPSGFEMDLFGVIDAHARSVWRATVLHGISGAMRIGGELGPGGFEGKREK